MSKKIYVIGGANVDISARSNNKVIAMDSNPGKVEYSFGGVGHNIAVNLSKLSLNVSFVSSFSNDGFGHQLKDSCLDDKLDLSYSQTFDDYPSSLYIAILENDGDMYVAVSDMDILYHLDMDKLEGMFDNIKEDDIVIFDTNLSEKQIKYIVDHCKGKLYVDPISTTKAQKVKPYLSSLEMIKPNLLEAASLTGNEENDYKGMLEYFINAGCKSVVISLGSDGLAASDGENYYKLDRVNANVVNTTGAGDSFMAGYVYGVTKKKEFVECLKCAMAASLITIESIDTVSDKMSEEKLNEYYKLTDKTKVEKL